MTKEKKTYLSYLFIAFIPIILYFAALKGQHVPLSDSVFNFLGFIPYIGLVMLAFLGLRLNQTRITFVALILLACYYWLHNPTFFINLGIGRIRSGQIISMAIPLTYCAIFAFKETHLKSWHTLGRLGIALLPFTLLIGFFALAPGGFHKMASWNFLWKSHTFKIPLLAFFFSAIYVVVANFLHDKNLRSFRYALAIAIIPAIYSAHILTRTPIKGYQLTFNIVIPFTVLIVILMHSIFKMYWNKVYIDELTEIPNRRALDEMLLSLKGEYTLGMVDIDHFKKFNDTYGHDQGDSVLRCVANHIYTESNNRAYRYGGEEFFIVFKNVEAEDAYIFANKIRRKLEERPFYIRKEKEQRAQTTKKARGQAAEIDKKKVQITISIGLASPNKNVFHPQDVIKEADKALYKAKQEGRNCVIVNK